MSSAVIGLGFGDEGKGVTVDWLCSLDPDNKPMVVRYSGGQQAGHNVVSNGVQHVFSNFGAGTIQGCPTFWSKECTVDPVGMKNEYDILAKKGIKPRLILDLRCPVTTPWEKWANLNNDDTMKHGSVGVGFYETLKREQANFSLQIMDIDILAILSLKLDNIQSNYHGFIIDPDDRDQFIDACQWMVQCPDIQFTKKNYINDENIVYEGSQGLLLDKDIGFFPHCTPSNVGSKAVYRHSPRELTKYYVTRAYQTRHGNGPMTNRAKISINNPNETNGDHGTQGVFRKSMLDVDLLEYGLKRDGGKMPNDVLIMTCLEHLDIYRYFRRGSIIEADTPNEFAYAVATELGFTWAGMFIDHKFKWVGNE